MVVFVCLASDISRINCECDTSSTCQYMCTLYFFIDVGQLREGPWSYSNGRHVWLVRTSGHKSRWIRLYMAEQCEYRVHMWMHYLRNKKHLYQCFIAVIKYGYEFGCVWIESQHASERVPIIYYRDKTRVNMFYFDSNTTVPLHCAALVFLESVFWQDAVWLTVPWDPYTISLQSLIKLIA